MGSAVHSTLLRGPRFHACDPGIMAANEAFLLFFGAALMEHPGRATWA